ncbi:MAG TPA: hypothetical protein VMQ86_13990 [Bryobacteraceae bacterium]|jgi:proteasome lid subunit RPN8/RPN11|nr:hypothetical protein [Bryobacteraceae bacterium]
MTETDAGPQSAPKFAIWNPPGQPFRIEYSVAVLEQIREIAVDGYYRLPRGGVETGGILFGTHQGNAVRIAAWREVVCEYAKGPSFLLSEKDVAGLAEAFKVWRGDADLASLEPVGWYRAHTRSEVLLADADLTFFNRFFPRPWHVGLIVRPASFTPTRAGFFFREAGGGIRAQSSYLEFTLAPVAAAPMLRVAEAPDVVPEPASALATEPRPVLQTEPHLPVSRRGSPWKWYAAGLAVPAVAFGFWLVKPFHASLTLSATDLGRQQLRIAWDGAARSIGHAKRGSIEIDDNGIRTKVNLTPVDLRSGNLFYERQSGDVAVRLTVDVPGDSPLVEATRFLKPGERSTVASPQQAPQQDAAKPPGPPPPQPQPTASLPAASPPVSLQPSAPVKSTRRVIPFRAPSPRQRQAATDIRVIAPPKIEIVPVPPSVITSMLGRLPVSPAAPAPGAPPSPRPTAATAASGRIVWTGKLAKNGRLVVERNHASSGAVNGALPAVAAMISAYPGAQTASGITLFTPDRRYARPLTEQARAENGWKRTTYTWDPKRAGRIRVVEQPGPQNGYKVVIESDIPKLSVVVLEWHATH